MINVIVGHSLMQRKFVVEENIMFEIVYHVKILAFRLLMYKTFVYSKKHIFSYAALP